MWVIIFILGKGKEGIEPKVQAATELIPVSLAMSMPRSIAVSPWMVYARPSQGHLAPPPPPPFQPSIMSSVPIYTPW